MRVKRIDQKHLCELAECLPRDFKKIKMAIDRNDSCRQFLFNLKDPSTNMQANNPRKRKEPVITAESSSKAEEDSSIRSTKPPQADSCAPSNGIHSMVNNSSNTLVNFSSQNHADWI
jgi:hypothetical protein